jgi:hypothetical protein
VELVNKAVADTDSPAKPLPTFPLGLNPNYSQLRPALFAKQT